MPNASTHDRITLWGLPFVAGATLAVTRRSDLTLTVAASYLLGGLMFGPDLDIYSRQYQRWGIFRWIWRPYQQTLRHRSFWSHGFLIGTILRLLYLSIWIAGISLCFWFFVWGYQQFTAPQGYLAATPLFSPQFGQRLGQAFQALPALLQKQIWSLVTGFWPGQGQLAIASFVGLEAGAMSHSLSDVLGSWWKRQAFARPKGKKPRPHKRR